jgi:hypothetical protein
MRKKKKRMMEFVESDKQKVSAEPVVQVLPAK